MSDGRAAQAHGTWRQGDSQRARRRSSPSAAWPCDQGCSAPVVEQGAQARSHLRADLPRHGDPARGQQDKLTAALVQTVLLIGVFIPFSYFMDRVIWPGASSRSAPWPELVVSSMSLEVDQLELGPIGTNTYLVRASAGATEAVVVDDPTVMPPRSRRRSLLEAPPAQRSSSPTPRRSHRRPRRPGSATGAAISTPRAARRILMRSCCVHAAGWVVSPRLGGRRLEARRRHGRGRRHLRGRQLSGPLVRATPPSYRLDGHLFRRDLRLRRLGRPRQTLPGRRTGQVLEATVTSLLDAYPPDTVVIPVTARQTTPASEPAAGGSPLPRRSPRGAGSAVAGGRPSAAPDTRGTGLLCRRSMPLLGARSGEVCSSGCARSIPLPLGARRPASRTRGLFGSQPRVRAGLGCHPEGDVTSPTPDRPLTAVPGHRSDRRAYLEHGMLARPAAREDVHRRPDVPLRPPRRVASRALAGSVEAMAAADPVVRRRGDPGCDTAAAHQLGERQSDLELNSIG